MSAVSRNWFTIGQVAEKTQVDVQRIGRMVDNKLLGMKDPKTNVRFIHKAEIEKVKRIVQYMDLRPNVSYLETKQYFLKEELIDEHNKHEEVNYEIALHTIFTILEAQQEAEKEMVTINADRIEDKEDKEEKIITEKIEPKKVEKFEPFETGLMKMLSASRMAVAAADKNVQKQEELMQELSFFPTKNLI